VKALTRGIALGVLQCLLVLSLAGKFAWDRERLPRAWARTAPVDPNLPIRGRYLSLRVEVAVPPEMTGIQKVDWFLASLTAENGRLTAHPSATRTGSMVTRGREFTLMEPVAYFIPEHAPDPSRLHPGEELWVELTVPRSGPPRPIRLAIKRDGVLTPLAVR
jgi:hypothetical protein